MTVMKRDRWIEYRYIILHSNIFIIYTYVYHSGRVKRMCFF